MNDLQAVSLTYKSKMRPPVLTGIAVAETDLETQCEQLGLVIRLSSQQSNHRRKSGPLSWELRTSRCCPA